MKTMTELSTGTCDTAIRAVSTDFERQCRERRRALEDMRRLEEDLRREQAQRRFQRIRYGNR